MKKPAFTLVELVVVITIIALASTVGVSVWTNTLHKAEFDDKVVDIISIFQSARSYALKSTEIDGEMYDYFRVYYDAGEEFIALVGNEADELLRVEFDEAVTINEDNWHVDYETPYADATTDTGDDIVITVSSLKSGFEQEIVVHNLSGIAEER